MLVKTRIIFPYESTSSSRIQHGISRMQINISNYSTRTGCSGIHLGLRMGR